MHMRNESLTTLLPPIRGRQERPPLILPAEKSFVQNRSARPLRVGEKSVTCVARGTSVITLEILRTHRVHQLGCQFCKV